MANTLSSLSVWHKDLHSKVYQPSSDDTVEDDKDGRGEANLSSILNIAVVDKFYGFRVGALDINHSIRVYLLLLLAAAAARGTCASQRHDVRWRRKRVEVRGRRGGVLSNKNRKSDEGHPTRFFF